MRRIYSETLPFPRVVASETMALLARYELEVVLAVRPWDLTDLPDVARALRDAGVSLSVWPMLADADGRWASVRNAPAFAELLLRTCDALASAPPRDVLLDLEPPFALAKALAEGARPRLRAPPDVGGLAARTLAGAAEELHARGITTSMAVWPLVALDPPGRRGWQNVLGTPVDAVPAAHVSAMMYSSMIEGWSRGALRRGDALALLSAATTRTARRWGARAGMSVGCVGTGAFEDEPTYRGPRELAEDVAVVRASGVTSLALFDLGGVLARPPAEAWLDAFCDASRMVVPTSKRVWAARRFARAATWALR